MNLTIKPGAATQDAIQIDKIVETIASDMEELNRVFNDEIGTEKLITTWSSELYDNWKNYYDSRIPDAMEEMKASATNLRLAVQEALKYDK